MALALHADNRFATRNEVAAIQAPPPTRSWHPRSHISVVAKMEELLEAAGYQITRQQYVLSHRGARFFAAFDIECPLVAGVTLALGLRNSIDKSFPYGLAGGTRTTASDSLALSGNWDALTIRKKHTINGERDFVQALGNGIDQLGQFRESEIRRLDFMRRTELLPYEADAWMIKFFKREIISARMLPEVIRQWEEPQFDWGRRGTLYHLYQALTTPLQPHLTSNPARFADTTMQIIGLLLPHPRFDFDEREA